MLAKSKHFSWLVVVTVLCFAASPLNGQQAQQPWFRTGTGIGVDKIRLAVADFGPRADNAKTHSQQFTQIVRDDLAFSGILDLVSPSFYPAQSPTQPSELQNAA